MFLDDYECCSIHEKVWSSDYMFYIDEFLKFEGTEEEEKYKKKCTLSSLLANYLIQNFICKLFFDVIYFTCV